MRGGASTGATVSLWSTRHSPSSSPSPVSSCTCHSPWKWRMKVDSSSENTRERAARSSSTVRLQSNVPENTPAKRHRHTWLSFCTFPPDMTTWVSSMDSKMLWESSKSSSTAYTSSAFARRVSDPCTEYSPPSNFKKSTLGNARSPFFSCLLGETTPAPAVSATALMPPPCHGLDDPPGPDEASLASGPRHRASAAPCIRSTWQRGARRALTCCMRCDHAAREPPGAMRSPQLT
mmetsp:Transcript_50150/g.160623  ORF Transcript_50150/g.160623 Transcript_50150/m.160623 type:complete len:234 (-) Transcript_50150:186-887(-)